ncbi:MAG: hypothetical protein ACI8R0_002456, partial [Alteromonadales bacterium]
MASAREKNSLTFIARDNQLAFTIEA